jgi:hypothetical protein
LLSAKGWIPFLSRTGAQKGVGGAGLLAERSVGDLWMEFLLKEVGETPSGGGSGGEGATEGKVVVP